MDFPHKAEPNLNENQTPSLRIRYSKSKAQLTELRKDLTKLVSIVTKIDNSKRFITVYINYGYTEIRLSRFSWDRNAWKLYEHDKL